MTHNLMFTGGWILVPGETGFHWVYAPLWDPTKFNEVGRAIFATQVIKQHLAFIINNEARELLTSVLKEQAQVVTEKFAASVVDDADENRHSNPLLSFQVQVPAYVPHVGGGDGPDAPDYNFALGKELSDQVTAKISISLLGRVLKHEAIIKAGAIM